MAQTKEQKAASGRKHYAANKEAMKARAKAYTIANRERLRQHVLEYKREHPCVDCGETDPLVLQFDHVNDDKECNVADMVTRSVGLERLKKEIEKCEVVCANDHLRRTHARRISTRSGEAVISSAP